METGPCCEQCWLGMAAKTCSCGLERRKDEQSRKPCPKAWKNKPKSMLGPASLLLDGFPQTEVWDEGRDWRQAAAPSGVSEWGRTPKSCLRMGTRADGHWDVPWHRSGCQAGISRGWKPLESSKRSFPPEWDGEWWDGREFWVLCWLQVEGTMCQGVIIPWGH